MWMRVVVVGLAGLLVTSTSLFAQAADPGRQSFETRCARCHGADGRGGEMGPAIVERLTPLDDEQIRQLVREGQPLKGMPPNVVPDPEMAELLKFLRTIQRTAERPLVRISVQTTEGRTLDGLVLGEGFDDLQLQTDDKRVHLLSDVGNAVADLQRRSWWQPLHDTHSDRQDYGGQTGAEVDADNP
jgi:alcohol dehydrogenase (cytochrome c)